ncbi:MAG: DUF1688 family protein [Bdellovibrionales bacterium]|nr:DUF1688 family protein [Bdellovibrionales bacterium]
MNKIDYILSPQAIRERTRAVFALAERGGTHFAIHPEKLADVARLVIEVTQSNYPTLQVPFHSRWGHFRAGGKDRLSGLRAQLKSAEPLEAVRTLWDLVIPSVLLDAGAGDRWKFTESDGKTVSRSEGLGVASLALFESGALSSDLKNPLRADAEGLKSFSAAKLEKAFQVSESNPLVGCAGRASLLKTLGATVAGDPLHFPSARVGALADYLVSKFGKNIPAPALLKAVLEALGPIWPGRLSLEGQALGDVWTHSGLGPTGSFESLVPFHKLSQWLTYSLIEPLLDAGFQVNGVEELTGLAEYRNGGLVLDGGLISLRDPSLAQKAHRPDSELVVEWRALTLVWLEKIAEEVRRQLKMTPSELPLAKVLEGGTWWAGRRLAKEKRPLTSNPPLELLSDGTVF